MTIAYVQSKSAASSADVSSLSVTLDNTPTAGNLLVACVIVGSSSSSITPPANWATATSTSYSPSLDSCIFYLANCGTGTTYTFNFSVAGSAAICIAEYSGLAYFKVLDVTSTNLQNSTTISTGTTTTTTVGDELWVASLSYVNASALTLGSPGNSFTREIQADATGGTNIVHICLCDRVVSSTSVASTSETISSSSRGIGSIACFSSIPLPIVDSRTESRYIGVDIHQLLAVDDFARSYSPGFGTASDGSAWTIDGGSTSFLSCNGTSGVLTGTTSSQRLIIGSNTTTDGIFVARFSASDVADNVGFLVHRQVLASSVYVYLYWQNATLKIATSTTGTTYTFSGTATRTNGTYYWLKLQIVGNQWSVRYWQDGTNEPSTWFGTVTVGYIGNALSPGRSGLYLKCYASGDTVTVDNLYIAEYPLDKIVESESVAVGIPASDSAILTESITVTKSGGTITPIPASDSAAISDTESLKATLSVTSSITDTESVGLKATQSVVENITETDTASLHAALSPSDSATLSDSESIKATQAPYDNANISATTGLTAQDVVSDTASLSETESLNVVQFVTEDITEHETVATNKELRIGDITSIAEETDLSAILSDTDAQFVQELVSVFHVTTHYAPMAYLIVPGGDNVEMTTPSGNDVTMRIPGGKNVVLRCD